MSTDWVDEAISVDRFAFYLASAGGDRSVAIDLYHRNLELSASIYQWLALAEVVLRNALISSLFPAGDRQADFDPFVRIWTELRAEERADYEKARARVQAKGRLASPDRIVAELNFGFWRYLLAGDYEHTLWTGHFRHAFVGLPRKNRGTVYQAVERVNQLRNRIAHHERVLEVDLKFELEALISLIGWISLDALMWANDHLPPISKSEREINR